MEITELKSYIETVLQKETNDLENVSSPWVVKSKKGVYELEYPNADILINIFSMIQNKDNLKQEYVSILCDTIGSSRENYVFIGEGGIRLIGDYVLCFYVLTKLGFVKEAITSLNSRRQGRLLLLLLLNYFQIKDYSHFDNAQLGNLLGIIKRTDIPQSPLSLYTPDRYAHLRIMKKSILTNIINNRITILKEIIRGVNVEINQDKKSVIEKIGYLEFDEKYIGLLNEIDNFINTETSNVLNSGMINNLRVFMHDIVIDIADKIAKAKREEIPKVAATPIGNARPYIKKELMLSDNDHKFISAFIDILHDEGGHSFMSTKEYFRLARNIAIEIALLILSKYEKMILQNPKSEQK